MKESLLAQLDLRLEEAMAQLAFELRRELVRGAGVEVLRTRADGDVTRGFDERIETALLAVLERSGLPFAVSSEECGSLSLSGSPEYLAIIDPLDGSTAAARALPLCSIAISIVDLASGLSVSSHIREVFTDSHFHASSDVALRNGQRARPSSVVTLDEALLVSYLATPARLRFLPQAASLLANVHTFINYGGILDIAKVGTSQVDLFVEFARGFKPHDCVAGLHFASVAGATVSHLDGSPLLRDITTAERTRFVVAGTAALHDAALRALSDA